MIRKIKKEVGCSFKENIQYMDQTLPVEKSFDIIRREMEIGGKESVFYYIDGFIKDEAMLKIMDSFLSITAEDLPQDAETFSKQKIPYVEVDVLKCFDDILRNVLSGTAVFFVEGYDAALCMDCRSYPARGVDEPDKDKSLRGSRDGFVETIVFNTALMRRRIRDPHLIMEMTEAGQSSRTDIAVCYMSDRVDEELLNNIKSRIEKLEVDDLRMNQQSLAEALFKRKWFNPFPKFKFTERPDTAAACLLEGKVVILVDNSPSAMILPTSILDMIEEANDYYFPPVTGTYLRLTRMLTNILAVFITPLFLLLIENPDWVPSCLEFILIRDDINVAPIFQLLILEFAIDGLKMAAVNTPNMLTTPLSIVAGIVFGDYTVDSGWFNPEIMLYMAFVAVANYTQSNMELTYAVKFHRIILLILTSIFGICGFIAGTVIFAISLLMTHTLLGEGYLYPIIPFDGRCLMRRFFRMSLPAYEKTHR